MADLATASCSPPRRLDTGPETVPLGTRPEAEAIEVDVDNRRGVQRQQLAENQSANDGNAQGAPYLGAIAGPKRQGQGSEQGSDGCHQDRSQAQKRCTVNCLPRIETLLPLQLQCAVDHHD